MSMNQEYRRELRQLAKTEKKILSQYEQHKALCAKQSVAAMRSCQRAAKLVTKEVYRIQRRRMILQGRLS